MFSHLVRGTANVLCFATMNSVVKEVQEPFALERGGADDSKGRITDDADEALLQYIRPGVRRTWKKQNFSLVIGILSPDVNARRRRRTLQRLTCWRFSGVATARNSFLGEVLPLYVLARHPTYSYRYSAVLEEEARQWQDIVSLPINEGRISTGKRIGDGSFWGHETEIGMSRKTFLWLDFALRFFTKTHYIAKGDDDMFLRVPRHVANLKSLPDRNLYLGFSMPFRYPYRFRYADGSCFTLTRDLVERIVSYKPLRRLVQLPFSEQRREEFLLYFMDHEDMMVGHALFRTTRDQVNYATVRRCHFHNVRGRNDVYPVTDNSVLLHNIAEEEYASLYDRFSSAASNASGYDRTAEGFFFRCDKG
ncbi:hypothetical protein ERJ75_000066900 [Trypanosoma vivax]|nr:hypothetical protein ERJ75_000066900 [Trypanosoma vivax]